MIWLSISCKYGYPFLSGKKRQHNITLIMVIFLWKACFRHCLCIHHFKMNYLTVFSWAYIKQHYFNGYGQRKRTQLLMKTLHSLSSSVRLEEITLVLIPLTTALVHKSEVAWAKKNCVLWQRAAVFCYPRPLLLQPWSSDIEHYESLNWSKPVLVVTVTLPER